MQLFHSLIQSYTVNFSEQFKAHPDTIKFWVLYLLFRERISLPFSFSSNYLSYDFHIFQILGSSDQTTETNPNSRSSYLIPLKAVKYSELSQSRAGALWMRKGKAHKTQGLVKRRWKENVALGKQSPVLFNNIFDSLLNRTTLIESKMKKIHVHYLKVGKK